MSPPAVFPICRLRSLEVSLAIVLAGFAILAPAGVLADSAELGEAWIRRHYAKFEYRVPMRDGARLFTSVYVPLDRSEPHPILLVRTPYSVRPYGADQYPETLGPSESYAFEKWIFAYQDVRGTYMSEGEFVNMRPHISAKQRPSHVDESTDTYDTVEWLVENIEGNNRRVGQWGISYPGFYAAAGMIDTHPALVAVSPQAPIADWFFDDFHHHGAFFLPHAFNFFASFGRPRTEPTTERPPRYDYGTPDGYEWYLRLGPLANAREKFGADIAFWDELVSHPDYDEFWQARNLLPHLRNVRSAVMTVGGWFDAEDLYGPFAIYHELERNNPDIFNVLVIGPWAHGDWGRRSGESLGDISFGYATGDFYREEIELPFFRALLEEGKAPDLPEAFVFETGANRWRRFETWPPAETSEADLYFREGGVLSTSAPELSGPTSAAGEFDEFVSDPAKSVPFTDEIATGMTRAYMTGDQRFAARRPDVLVWQTEPLENDWTLAGPVDASLFVSTSGEDADWIVKLIDVFPGSAPDPEPNPRDVRMGGYQMMVRSEVMRGRYREGYDAPLPFERNKVTRVELPLQDVFHTFQRGHRVMIQLQSTWFPLVDRNPQSWVENIFLAGEDDFIKATHRLWRTAQAPSHVTVHVLGRAGD